MQTLIQYHWQTAISRPSSECSSSNLKRSISHKTLTINMQSVFPSVANHWSFQDHLPRRSLLAWRMLSWKTSMATKQYLHPVSPLPACHFKMSPKYKSTKWKSSVSQETWIVLSRSSSSYISIDVKTSVLGDLNSDCEEFLTNGYFKTIFQVWFYYLQN